MTRRRIVALVTTVPAAVLAAGTVGGCQAPARTDQVRADPPAASCAVRAPTAGVTPAVTVPAATVSAATVPAGPIGATASATVGAPRGPANTPGASPVPAVVGAVLPALSLPCLDGVGSIALRDLRGPLVINFWASWCAPCRTELPEFERFAQRSGGRVAVLGVASRDTRGAARALVADFGLTFPSVLDERMELAHALGYNNLPMTLVIDGQGRVRHVATGAVSEAELTEFTAELLGAAR